MLSSFCRFSTSVGHQSNRLRVLITGGSKGVGLGITEIFASKLCNVLTVDIDKDANDWLASSEINKNGNIHCLTLNVIDPETATQCIGYMTNKWDGIDVLINNVGVELANDKKIHEIDDDIWHRSFAVNVTSFFYFSKQAIRQMLKQINMKQYNDTEDIQNELEPNYNYNIINIASPCGLRGAHFRGAYSASKAAVNGLTNQMAIEYAPDIRVNAITPGAILTPSVRNALKEQFNYDNPNDFVADQPMKRFGNATEIGNMAWYLASDEARFITGANMIVDGGITIKASWT